MTYVNKDVVKFGIFKRTEIVNVHNKMADFDEEEELDIGEYTGERDDSGQRSGLGKMVFPNGDVYEGMYLNGMRNGKGKYTWKKGGMFEGEYLNHKRHGFGIMHYPDGSIYQGIWFEGWRHGKGTYTYPNGDSYEGDWQFGRRHGLRAKSEHDA